jgi:hypothetical protein
VLVPRENPREKIQADGTGCAELSEMSTAFAVVATDWRDEGDVCGRVRVCLAVVADGAWENKIVRPCFVVALQ